MSCPAADQTVLSVFDQIMKYRRRMKEEKDDPEKVRYSLKRLCALEVDASVISNTNITKRVKQFSDHPRNGHIAKYLLDKWQKITNESDQSPSKLNVAAAEPTTKKSAKSSSKDSTKSKSSSSNGIKMPKTSSTIAILNTPDLFAPAPQAKVPKLAIKRKAVDRKSRMSEEDKDRPALSLPDIDLPSTKLDWSKLQRADQEMDKKRSALAASASKSKSESGSVASYVPVVKRVKPSAPSSFSDKNINVSEAKSSVNGSKVDALDAIMLKPKQSHSAMFSGRRREPTYTTVPTLFDACMHVICANVDAIEDTGDIPFEILQPALQRATPDQLYNIEELNPYLTRLGMSAYRRLQTYADLECLEKYPIWCVIRAQYLIEDTQDLWQVHCAREFRCGPDEKQNEHEHWRDIYQLKLAQRDSKLNELKCSIKKQHTGKMYDQERTTKLSEPKAPREVRRAQAKFGTGTRGKAATDILELTRAKRTMMDLTSTQRKFQKPAVVRETMLKSNSAAGVYQSDRVIHKQRAPPGASPIMRKSMKMFKNAGRR